HAFNYGFEAMLFNGFGTLVVFGTSWVVWFTLLLELIVFSAMLFAAIGSFRKYEIRIRARRINAIRNMAKLKQVEKTTKAMDQAFSKWTGLFSPLVLPIGFFLVSLLSILFSDYQAIQSAKRTIEKARKFDSSSHIVGLSNGRTVNLGPLIGCDDFICIYMAKDRAVVIKRDLINAETAAFPLSK
ncbi:MAG: hypothetical protein ABI644_14110, partial [Arenimonas sp.]